MTVAWLFLGLWLATLSAPAGWIMGARFDDDRGLIGYIAALLAIISGVLLSLGW